MAKVMPGDKFIIEVAENYIPEDARNHRATAAPSLSRLRGLSISLATSAIERLPRYEGKPATQPAPEKPCGIVTKWKKFTRGRTVLENKKYIVMSGGTMWLMCWTDGGWRLTNGELPRFPVDAYLSDIPEYN